MQFLKNSYALLALTAAFISLTACEPKEKTDETYDGSDGNVDSETRETPTDCDPGCSLNCTQGCFDMGECEGETLTLFPNIHTVGVISVISGESPSAALYYRTLGNKSWNKGHDAVRIPDGRLATSIFHLSPEENVEVMLTGPDGTACGSVSTMPDIPAHETIETLYVDTNAATEGNGSSDNPFASIQNAIASADAGTDIIVRPGIYEEDVRIEKSGMQDRYIRILGEAGAILDGSTADILTDGLAWSEVGGGVYTAPFDGNPTYLTRDGKRMYHFTSLSGLENGLGDDDVPMNEGWFADSGNLYVRCLKHPDTSIWQIPRLTVAVTLDGASWIWIEGLTIRYYGEGDYPKGIDIRNSTHIVVKNNIVHDTPSPIWVRRGSEYIRIEGNSVYQSGMDEWPWESVKGTDHENSGISVEGAGRTIVRGNRISHIFNGIYTGSFDDDLNSSIAFDVDVYDNQLANIGDDGLEPEGACVNNRFWNNTVDTQWNGISLAPITFGPVWVIGNRFTDFGAGGIKLSNNSSGRVWIYHNTCYTDRPDLNGMTVSGPFENIVMRNNLIRGTRYAFEMSIAADLNDFDYDNFYTTRGAPVIKWDNIRYDTMEDMCTAVGLECNGQPLNPKLVNPAAGQYALSTDSPNVDRGMRIYGINDTYTGAAPDIGYNELGEPEPPPFE